jgi:hypothetical protein
VIRVVQVSFCPYAEDIENVASAVKGLNACVH